MPPQKLYPEEFLVRATTEELRLIDELARRYKKSRSRFMVTTALIGGCQGAVDLPLFEAMLEVRRMALVDLRCARYRLERIADLLKLQAAVTACDLNLQRVIDDLASTTLTLKKVWA